MVKAKFFYSLALLSSTPAALYAQNDGSLPAEWQAEESPGDEDQIILVGRRSSLVGEAVSASEGRVGRQEIDSRPLLRSGDLLEFVPGLVATQHSGSGKANQYFLRGFNLDHGTDFATFVEAMPVNMRSHGHGQGWTDLNFLIPEAVQEIRYRKGTYYADVGDFSSAGSARFLIAEKMPRGIAEFTAGSFGYLRGFLWTRCRLEAVICCSGPNFRLLTVPGPTSTRPSAKKPAFCGTADVFRAGARTSS